MSLTISTSRSEDDYDFPEAAISCDSCEEDPFNTTTTLTCVDSNFDDEEEDTLSMSLHRVASFCSAIDASATSNSPYTTPTRKLSLVPRSASILKADWLVCPAAQRYARRWSSDPTGRVINAFDEDCMELDVRCKPKSLMESNALFRVSFDAEGEMQSIEQCERYDYASSCGSVLGDDE